MTSDQLHEFSTGIRPQKTADGWVSVGFTGQYMNATIDPPHAVQRSIANKEFAVAEGGDSDRPAIVGRVVPVPGDESDWSVVALVSKGWDEKGRSASFYRYFLCQGEDKLPKIIAWIEQYRKEHQGQYPVFDPFKQGIGDDLSQLESPSGKVYPQDLMGETILKPNQLDQLEQINALAEAKANGQPVSWAYNAEAVEQPWRFLVIQVGSDRAYQILKKAVANLPQVQAHPAVDEDALKSAIEHLISRSSIESEAIEQILNALEEKQLIPPEYWKSLFDSQGARNALSQKIYGSQMVRLLTLRTLTIPETLPEYLDWLQVKENLKKRNFSQAITAALEFQAKLRDLLMTYSIIEKQCQTLLQGLINYQLPASFLENIGDYTCQKLGDDNLSLMYYKIAAVLEQNQSPKHLVSKRLFKKAFPGIYFSQQKVGEHTIYKEKERLKTGADTVHPQTVIIIAISCLFAGGLGGYFLREKLPPSQPSTRSTPGEKTQTTPSSVEQPGEARLPYPHPSSENQAVSSIPQAVEKTAIEKFPETAKAINQVVQEIEKNQKIARSEVVSKIISILGGRGQFTLDYSGVIEEKLPATSENYQRGRQQWIEAIYDYQKRIRNKEVVGYLNSGGSTAQRLKTEVNEQIKTISPLPKVPQSVEQQ